MLRYRKTFDDVGARNGVDVALAGFFVDGVISDALGRVFNDVNRQFELIAKRADKVLDIGAIDNVPLVTELWVTRVQSFLRYQDRQISNLREVLSGQEPDLTAQSSAVPTNITADALAVLGGADVNPQTNEASRSDDGSYVVDGALAVGLLYTGKKVMDVFSNDYFDEFGHYPELKLRWEHYTPVNRELYAHAALDNRTYTLAERPFVLANTTVPWLGPFFRTQDHQGCLCGEHWVLV